MGCVETKIEDVGSENAEGLVPAIASCVVAARMPLSTAERPSTRLLQGRRGLSSATKTSSADARLAFHALEG